MDWDLPLWLFFLDLDVMVDVFDVIVYWLIVWQKILYGAFTLKFVAFHGSPVIALDSIINVFVKDTVPCVGSWRYLARKGSGFSLTIETNCVWGFHSLIGVILYGFTVSLDRTSTNFNSRSTTTTFYYILWWKNQIFLLISSCTIHLLIIL